MLCLKNEIVTGQIGIMSPHQRLDNLVQHSSVYFSLFKQGDTF